jgi:hypothetical protein
MPHPAVHGVNWQARRSTLQLFECTLKAVAFTPSIGMIDVRETDIQGTTADVLAKNMRKLRAVHGLSQEALAWLNPSCA